MTASSYLAPSAKRVFGPISLTRQISRRCRMFRSNLDVWRGLARNATEGFGGARHHPADDRFTSGWTGPASSVAAVRFRSYGKGFAVGGPGTVICAIASHDCLSALSAADPERVTSSFGGNRPGGYSMVRVADFFCRSPPPVEGPCLPFSPFTADQNRSIELSLYETSHSLVSARPAGVRQHCALARLR